MNLDILFDVPVSPNRAAGVPGQVCAYPLTSVLQDGTVATVYRRGATKHSHDGVLVMQTSADGGATWTEPRTVFDGTAESPRRTVVTGGVVPTKSGSLLLACGVVEGLEPGVFMFDAAAADRPMYVLTRRSADGGRTWTPAAPLPTPGLRQAGITARPFLTALEEVAVLVEYRTAAGAQGTAIVFSRDEGRTFGAPTIAAADKDGRLSLCDARTAVLPDGRIVMLLWTFRQDDEETIEVHQAWSSDHGRSWTKPEGIGLVGQISAPLARPSGGTIALSNVRVAPDGIDLWHTGPDGRWNTGHRIRMWDAGTGRMLGERVVAAEARAAGLAVWNELPRFSFGTPDVVSLPDGSILMTYYATLDAVVHVRACRFRIREEAAGHRDRA